MKESIESYYIQLFSTISDKSCMECCKHFSKKAAVSNLGLNICKYDCTKCNVAIVAKDYFDNNLVDTTVRNLKVETDGSMANEDFVQLSDISGKIRAQVNVPNLLDTNILQGMKIVDLKKEKENLENENKEWKSAINENERVVQEATMTLKSQKEESDKKDRKIEELKKTVSNLLGKNTKLETEKTDLGTEKDDLHEKYIALDKENQELKKEVSKLKAKLKSEASEGDVIDESHKCLICYKTFTKNANLKNHIITVHNEKKTFQM